MKEQYKVLKNLSDIELEKLSADTIPYTSDSHLKIKKRFNEATARKKPGIRVTTILIAAVIAVLACGSVFAIYQKWSLPAPEKYEFGNNVNVNIQEEKVYNEENLNEADITPSADSESLFSDRYFIDKTDSLLKMVGIMDIDQELMIVTYQTNLLYNREEVEVSFSLDDKSTTATFNRKTGALIKFSSFAFNSEDHLYYDEQAAAEKAKEYYEMLPVPQGYTLTGNTRYDTDVWMFYYSREISDDLFNDYEQVRITLNPEDGRFLMCNVFYFPLLDDHDENDVPLTQTQAEAIAQALISEKMPNWPGKLESAEVLIVLPNWRFTEYEGGNLRYSDVSRLAWQLQYENKDSEFASILYINIDLYTGEILGGDNT